MWLELVALVSFPLLYALFAIWEHVAPARPLPKVAGWRLRGPFFLVALMGVSIGTGLFWGEWVAAHRLADLEWLGTIGGALVAFVGAQLVSYAWHRTMHRVPVLFRLFHQMHHSAERLDIAGAVYFHPLDMLGFAFAASFVPFMVLGVSAEAALLSGIIAALYALVQHANVKTPRWLGYVIQRPESHSLHHARGVHAWNYADLPLVDMLFGTFRNPEHFEPEQGYWDGASSEIGAMLLGRDVTAPSSTTSSDPPRAATLDAR